MASITKRGEGWQVKIRRKGTQSISRTFTLKADAETWAREVELEYERGNIAALRQDAQRITVAQVAQRYAEEVLPTLRSKSAGFYLRQVNTRFGPYYLGAVRSVDVANWMSDLLKDGLSAQSVIHYQNSLAALFTYAQRRLSIALPMGNVARQAPRPPLPRGRARRLEEKELAFLLRAATSTGRIVGLREIIVLAVETSMRLGELLGLEWSRVDLKKRTAHLVDTKNGESRTVALSSVALSAFDKLPRRLDGRVFGWAAADSFEKAWTRCKARALSLYQTDCEVRGVEPDKAFLADLRFHDLRHEATSRLFEQGLKMQEVASMTGHKSWSMLKRYTHVDAEELAKKLR